MYISELLVESEQQRFKRIVNKFLPFAKEHLGIDKLPKISFLDEPLGDTFGKYHNGTIRVVVDGRHPIDALRTLAHELIHFKQDLNGEIYPGAGDTGSPEENEANAEAGIIMRHFDQRYPELLKSVR